MNQDYLKEESSDNYLFEQEEENEEELSASEKEASGSDAKKHFQSLKTPLFEPSIKYRESDWLIKLIELNPHKMKQVIDWAASLAGSLGGRIAHKAQHISSLNFENIDSNRQIYFISIYDIDPYFYILKIQDTNGLVVSFRVGESSQKEAGIEEVLRKMGRRMPIFIMDHTNNVSYLSQLFTRRNNPANIVVVIQESLCLDFKRVGKWRFLRREMEGTEYRFYYNFLRKSCSIFQTVQHFHAIETANNEKVWKILGGPSFEFLRQTESHCLLSNITISFQHEPSAQQVAKVLNEGVAQVQRHQRKWDQSSNNHFPGAGSARKSVCSHCLRKKSEIICKGCSSVYEREINLCIGPCFQKFHEERQMFMKKEMAEVCKNAVFFDKRCKEIGSLLDVLIGEQSKDYLQFANYLQAKMVSALNRITAKLNDIDADQAQTND